MLPVSVIDNCPGRDAFFAMSFLSVQEAIRVLAGERYRPPPPDLDEMIQVLRPPRERKTTKRNREREIWQLMVRSGLSQLTISRGLNDVCFKKVYDNRESMPYLEGIYRRVSDNDINTLPTPYMAIFAAEFSELVPDEGYSFLRKESRCILTNVMDKVHILTASPSSKDSHCILTVSGMNGEVEKQCEFNGSTVVSTCLMELVDQWLKDHPLEKCVVHKFMWGNKILTMEEAPEILEGVVQRLVMATCASSTTCSTTRGAKVKKHVLKAGANRT
jgi:hypothetical protein